MIKAIETSYKGYRFRSRLEARWAVFFDALGVEWQYEPEGFELQDGTRYLPDFLLLNVTKTGGSLYAEVKPPDGSASKAKKFALALGRSVLLLEGAPALRTYSLLSPGDGAGGHLQLLFTDAKNLGRFGERPLSAFLDCAEHLSGTEVEQAVFASRSARFEFGESGARV